MVAVIVRAAGVVAGAHRVAVVEGVGGVPVLLHLLQPGVVVPVPRAPVRPRATGEVGVLYRRLEMIMEFSINFFGMI